VHAGWAELRKSLYQPEPLQEAPSKNRLGEQMTPFRILIADDHEWVRRGLRNLLASRSDLEICGEAVDGHDVIKKARKSKPDLILLDIGMPYISGLDAGREILASDPAARILIITVHSDRQVAEEAWHLGASGFLCKSDARRELLSAIAAVQRGERFFPELEDDQYSGPNTSRKTPLMFPRASAKTA
jgi:DNA-binding NarL/FixJ family response regulator